MRNPPEQVQSKLPAGNIIILFADQLGKIVYTSYQLAYIAHFIIVPAHGFYQLGIAHCYHLGLSSIKKRAIMCADNITAHDLIFVAKE